MKPYGTQYILLVAVSMAAVAWGLVTYHTLSDIRKALIEKLVRLSMGYFEENGSIVQEGTHSELITRKGIYADLMYFTKSHDTVNRTLS